MALWDIATHREWQAPPAEESVTRRIGWLREAIQQGLTWVQRQRGAQAWRQSLDLLSGVSAGAGQELLEYSGQLTGARLRTNARIMVGSLSNIRPIWGFHAGARFSNYANMLNRVSWSLYLEQFWDSSIKDALAYAMATCTGWVRPVYRTDLRGRGNIELLTYGMPCVAPVQVPSSGNFQAAYLCTLLDEMPIYEAHWRFPKWQDRLRPTMSKYWYASEIRRSAERNADRRVRDWFTGGRRDDRGDLNEQYIPVAWTTINDARINDTGETIAMGQPGTSWYYEVPSLGSEIPDGRDENGNPRTRKANESDARMYPYRRLIISSEQCNCIMYDGPAFNWHGDLDLVPFYLDKWPWEPIGLGFLKDGIRLQQAIDEIDQGNMAKIRAQMDPALAYPIGAVDKNEAEDFDPMRPRDRIGYDADAVDQPFKSAVPPETYRIFPEAMSVRQVYQEELDYNFQTRDLVEMAKARALGKGMDQLEALAAADGPVLRDMGRGMEWSLGMLGKQIGSLEIQYLTTARIMQVVSPEGVKLGVFDYDPASIIPSHLPDEQIHDTDRNMLPSMYSPQQRARWFSEHVRFFLMPHSIHEVTQTVHKLSLMQMRQRGYPISAATIMDAFDVQDVDKPEGNTEQERFWAEKELEVHHAARLQKIVDQEKIDLSLIPSGVPPTGGQQGGGRPPSGAQPPHMKQQDGRPKISESA